MLQSHQSIATPNEYRRIERIGSGTYGIVYKAINTKTNAVVALKKIKLESSFDTSHNTDKLDSKGNSLRGNKRISGQGGDTNVNNDDEGVPSTAIREISALTELQPHPNIVGLLDVVCRPSSETNPSDKKLYLVFEYLECDFKSFLDNYPSNNNGATQLSGVDIFTYSQQLIAGIDFMHGRRLLHRDLKPQNLLINPGTKTLKVADFGLSRAFGIPLPVYTHEVVTLWYRAPEVLLGSKRYGTPIDVWSVGCIFAEMLTIDRKPIFTGDCEIDQLFKIFRILGTPSTDNWPALADMADYNPLFPKCDRLSDANMRLQFFGQNNNGDGVNDLALDLLFKMVIFDPSKRISCKAALKHPYFQAKSAGIYNIKKNENANPNIFTR